MKQPYRANEIGKDERAEAFAKRLAIHLTNKHHEPFEVLSPTEPNLWYIRSPSILAIHEFRDEEGRVYVESYDAVNLDYLFEEDAVYESSDQTDFLEQLKDRRKWAPLAERVCPHVVAYLTWSESVAAQASEEGRVKVTYWFPGPHEFPAAKHTHFRAEIDSRGMSDDEKIKAIEAHVPAVIKAYTLATDRDKSESFVEEFVRNIKLGKQSKEGREQ